ncbi:PQQ-binding-like beta-propeller repeat protein, partial [Myxococcota bacterium]|nr:PQQ-binding-like beta-propeller repeat protein [Myxococcota bacterium]
MRQGLAGAALAALLGCGGPDLGAPGDEIPHAYRPQRNEAIGLSLVWHRPLAQAAFAREDAPELSAPGYDAQRDLLIAGSSDARLYALTGRSGHVRWEKPLPGGTSAEILIDEGAAVVGTDQGALIALALEDGAERWRYKVPGAIIKAPVVEGDRLLFVDGTNTLFALDRRTGAWRWQYRREAPSTFALFGEARPLISGGRAFVGFSDGVLVALDIKDGAVLWTKDLSDSTKRFKDIDASPVMVGQRLFVASVSGGVYELDPSNGDVRKTWPMDGVSQMIPFEDEGLILGLTDAVARVDLEGRLRWRMTLRDLGAPGPLRLGQDKIIFASSKGGLHFLDRETGRPLGIFRPGRTLNAPPTLAEDGSVFLISDSAIAFALRPRVACLRRGAREI